MSKAHVVIAFIAGLVVGLIVTRRLNISITIGKPQPVIQSTLDKEGVLVQ